MGNSLINYDISQLSGFFFARLYISLYKNIFKKDCGACADYLKSHILKIVL